MKRFDALESEYMVVSSKPKISESHDKLNDSENTDNKCNIEPSDSASQVSGGVTNLSKASNRSTVRQIEIDKRRAYLKITHELQKEKILVKARAEEAEALAKLRLEEAALDAEEKLLACSERGSSVTSLRSSKSRRSKTEINITAKPKTIDLKTINLAYVTSLLPNHANSTEAMFKWLKINLCIGLRFPGKVATLPVKSLLILNLGRNDVKPHLTLQLKSLCTAVLRRMLKLMM